MTRIQNIRLTFVLITAALAFGCDTAEEAAPAGFTEVSFNPAKVAVSQAGAEQRLTFTGDIAGAPVELHLDLNEAAMNGMLGATQNISGETFFETSSYASFHKFEEHANNIVRAYAMGTCDGCEFDGSWQLVTGTFTIETLDDTTLGGRIAIVVEGDIPMAGGLQSVRTVIAGPFQATLPSQNDVTVTPEETTESTPVPETEPAATETPTPETNLPQGITTQKDTTPQGPIAATASPVYEATLYAGWGLNLATGETFKKANFANSDLYATQGHPYLKLTPGGSSPTKGQPLRWFKNSGGFVKSFGALTEVPLELPTDADGSQSIVSAKPYMGFIVKANLSNAYARVWVRTANKDQLTIEYQLIEAAE